MNKLKDTLINTYTSFGDAIEIEATFIEDNGYKPISQSLRPTRK
jgi:hypothetical protein